MGGVLAVHRGRHGRKKRVADPPLDEASPAYGTLCDLVASDRLLCVSGSGISVRLLRADGKTLPQWNELLVAVLGALRREMTPEARRACNELLSVDPPEGEMLIEAATLLERVNPTRF